MSVFLDYYNNLDTVDLVLIWVGIFAIIIIVGLAIYLYKKNKILVNLIKKQKDEINDIEKKFEDNKKITKEHSEDIIELKRSIEDESVNKIIDEEISKVVKEDNVYSNTLKNNNRRYQTSPINIVKEEKKENVSFTESLVKQMESEIKPQTIELTEFEKKQEEEAIISYKELLESAKDKVYQITDDEEMDDFIEELKSFRSDL